MENSKVVRVPKVESLPCDLSNDELLERGDKLVKLERQREEVEAERKATADDFKQRIEHLSFEAKQCRKQIESRTEYRDVECLHLFDVVDKKLRVLRLDNDDLVRERSMTAGELAEHSQADMGFEA